MKNLNCLNNESIELLNRSNLLRQLIKSEYIRDILEDVVLNKEVEQKAINDFLKGYGVTEKDNLEAWLKKNSLSKNQVKDIALSDKKLKFYCKENYGHQAEGRFLERKNKLDIYVYSLIRVKDVNKAKELYIRLISKEANFDDLAATHSEGIEKKTRGIIGPTSLERAHPQLAETVRTSKVNEIQPPFRIDQPDGKLFMIIRVEHYEAAKLDEIMKDKMALEIFDKEIEPEIDSIFQDLLKKEKVNKELGKI